MPPSTMDLDKRFYSGPSSGDLIFPNSHSIPPNQITSLHDEAIVQFVVYCELPQKIKINTSAVDVAMDLLLTRPTGENQSITNLKPWISANITGTSEIVKTDIVFCLNLCYLRGMIRPRGGQLSWLRVYFEKVAFIRGPYLLMEIEAKFK